MSIGMNIKKFRKERKLTQLELAERANLSRSYLADVEGDRYNPSVETLKTIASALNIQPHQLLDEPGNETATPTSLSPKEERTIAEDLERMLKDLESNEALAFSGDPDAEETKELLRMSLEHSLRVAKQLAKQKFNPNKNK